MKSPEIKVSKNLETKKDITEGISGEFSENFDFKFKDGESQEEFLAGINSLIVKTEREKRKKELEDVYNDEDFKGEKLLFKGKPIDLWDPHRHREWQYSYSEIYKKVFLNLLNESNKKEKLNKKKNEEVLGSLKISSSSREYDREAKNTTENINYFNNTNQERSFFPTNFKKDNVSYADSLFQVSVITEESKEYLKKKLNNKKICLLGGGKSVQDLSKSDFIKPKEIINIDPFVDEESIDRNINNNYKSFNLRADDENLLEKLKDEKIEQFDEIWASFSVPFYNTKKEEIDNLFKNIDSLLAENGNCRIVPLSTQNEECILEIKNKLNEMNESKKYNFHLAGGTLIIHKLVDESKKINDVRQKLLEKF
jgi:hypothetical protein